MRLFGFLLPRHRRFAELASAYVDGELRGGDLRTFEAHLQACAECQNSVAATRTLKTNMARLPEVSAPRSFRLTPQMVAATSPAKAPVRSGTPLYLGLARAGAALSVGAFATVLAIGALDSDGASDYSADGDREVQLTATDDKAGNESATMQDRSAAPESPPTPTPQPAIAPATGGGASGSGLGTTPAASATTASAPQPPATGAETPSDGTFNTYSDTVPAAGGDTLQPGRGVTSIAPLDKSADDDDGGMSGWAIGLGALAVASLLVLGGLEVRRRRA